MWEEVRQTGDTWLICGGRDFTDQKQFNGAMIEVVQQYGLPHRVVHGAARGADTLAGQWATNLKIEVFEYPADWKKHGKAAGPIRNGRMLSLHKPDLVIAFPGGRGTADMIKQANEAGVTALCLKF